ncbi:MAG: ParB/RepB/Spo0J family partition protein [Burkholderiales bacterium]
MIKPKGLGRGLDALLGGDQDTATPYAAHDTLGTLRVEQLQPGKYQPRTRMDEASLAELAASIRAQGLMQPILVRVIAGGRHEIIAGERRWRAAQLAGLTEVPVVIREVPDQSALAMALVENIQREDLNPLEEANGLQRLIDEFSLTHQEAADVVGRSRTAVTNLLRLLSLTKQVQEMVFQGSLDMGHARAVLGLEGPTQVRIAQQVVERNLSVRETEQLVHDTLHPKIETGGTPRPRERVSRDVQRLEDELADQLGTTVEIRAKKDGSGRLVLAYSTLDQLDGLLAKLRT